MSDLKAGGGADDRYRTLVELAPGAVAVVVNGLVVYANPACAELLGAKSASEIYYKPSHEFVHPDFREIVRGRLTRIAAGEKGVGWAELTYLRVDGTPIEVEALGTAITFEGVPALHISIRDISDRKRSELALIESERRFRSLVENSPQVVLVIRGGLIIFANYTASRTFDFNFEFVPDANESMVGTPAIDRIHPDSYAQAQDRVERLKKGEPIASDEFKCLRRDGSIVYMETVVSLILFDGARALQVSANDVTARKVAEIALQESEARYRMLIEKSPEAMLVVKDDVLIFANPFALALFGAKNPSDMIGKPRSFYIHKDSLEFALRRSRNAERGETLDLVDMCFLKVDRTPFFAEVNSIAMQYAGGPALQVVIRNVTDVRRATEALKNSEAFARTIADNIPGYLSCWSPDLHCVFANKAYLGMIGLNWSEIIGRHMSEIISPERYEVAFEYAMDAVHGVESGFNLTIPASDGTPRTIWVQFIPELDGVTVRSIFALGTDVTAFLEAQQATLAALALAEKANNAKSRFLAAASHDLRQPTTALSLNVDELLRTAPEKNLDLETRGVLGNLRGFVDTMSELLDDLLDVSKLEAGVLAPKLTHFRVDELLGSIVAENQAGAARKNLEFRYRGSDAVVYADRTLLQRVINNLVSNAIKYTERGGILLACRKKDGKFWTEVWDTGIGIPKEKWGIIFEEFQQVEPHGPTSQGSGLGLAIVAKTCALLGLELRFQSRSKRGSLFAVEVPLRTLEDVVPATEVETVQSLTNEPLNQLYSIALVDDECSVLEAMVRVLTRAGHRVYGGASWSEVYSKLGSVVPDLVISDYRLGTAHDDDGFDVIEKARKLFGYQLPALMLTGDTDPRLVKMMTNQGLVVLYKPLGMAVLKAGIAKAMQPFA